MGLKDIFNNCMICDRSGLFAKLDVNGHCPKCAAKLAEEKRKKEEEKRIRESSPSYLLNKYSRLSIPRPCMYQGASRVKTYFISLSEVERDVIYELTQREIFDVNLKIVEAGKIAVAQGDTVLAFLTDKIEMTSDWLMRGLPYICQLAEFQEDKERVVVHYFQYDESRYSDCQTATAKLTAYTSYDKQFNISVLEPGERLFVLEDDNGKWYVANVDAHELGKLPSRFAKMYEDDTLRAMFFDHSEKSENANGEQIEVPYVRFYFD